jgi:signal transduction histidine kinase
MKLLTKTTLYYLSFTLPLLLLSGFFLYNRIEASLKDEVDEELSNVKGIWIANLSALPAAKNMLSQNSPFIKIEISNTDSVADVYSDTLIYLPVEKENVPCRNLTTWLKKDKQLYKISFQRSVLEQEDVFSSLLLLMCFVFGGLFLLFLLINLYVNRKVWKPFNTSLEKITSLNMQQLQAIKFDKVSIKEFNALNNSLNAMTAKMNNDFISMKTFTQNASHEIQTPLAIIQSKLELLLQDSTLTEQQFLAISSANDATQRLSRLNQSLLMITRIEHNQFIASEEISLKIIIEKYVSFFMEMMEQKKIAHKVIINADWKILIHPVLADMLVSNLLTNAIKYSNSNSQIIIKLDEGNFSVSNSNNQVINNSTNIFNRFSKDGITTGNGLGLAIVKEICDTNNLLLAYLSSKEFHEFSITQKNH